MQNSLKSSEVSVYKLNSFDDLCYGRTPAGEKYYDVVKNHTIELATAYLENHPDFLEQQQGTIAVIGIPRGGMATAAGLQEAFCAKAQRPDKIVLVESKLKTPQDGLYPEGLFEQASALVITDGIIATGKTVIDHLDAIPREWKGMIGIFANAAARMGLEAINQAAAAMTQKVEGVVGRVFEENECKWVDFSGKKVYFVGMDCGIPDFGDHITLAAPRAPALK